MSMGDYPGMKMAVLSEAFIRDCLREGILTDPDLFVVLDEIAQDCGYTIKCKMFRAIGTTLYVPATVVFEKK